MIEVRFTHTGSDSVGVIALNEHGVAVADNQGDQAFIATTHVMEPDTVKPLSPNDGERYLRALPANFYNAYFQATFYDDDKPVKQPWLRSQGGTVPDPPPTDYEKALAIIEAGPRMKLASFPCW